MQKEEEIKIIRLDVDALLYIISKDEILKLFRFSKREVEIIRMRWRERMTFPQIAKKLSLTPETIRHNYHRIFRRLMCRTIRFIETYQSHVMVTADNERLKSENDGLKKSIKDMEMKHKKIEFNQSADVPNIEIAEMENLSVRTYNALDALGAKTLSDILKYRKRDLSRTRSIGGKTLAEIEGIVKCYGFQLQV